MPRRARVSPEKILAAAAREFAQRGYAGARVDRIARLARVNKAMLYYHFGSKQELYRHLLRHTFGAVAADLEAIAASSQPHSARLHAAVTALARFVETRAYFPSIMLREVAEGGTHLDAETLAALAAVPRSFAAILKPGVDAGHFRPIHPLAAYFTSIAPILMFVASAPLRKRILAHGPMPGGGHALELPAFLADFEASLQRAFASATA